ncbi:hypothetical protein ACHAWF_015360 [Thalassiosira exigua]
MSETPAAAAVCCASCGNGGDGLKACAACKLVKYCSVACQRAHRPRHKRECRKRAAELHDEALFADPPPKEDCPICCLPMPLHASAESDARNQMCCGKTICEGCAGAASEEDGDLICPFCRSPIIMDDDEAREKIEARANAGDAVSICKVGNFHFYGQGRFPQDTKRAFELWLRAGKLGAPGAYNNMATAYFDGNRVGRDMGKAKHYWEQAAIGGHIAARHNIGLLEAYAGNTDRAAKHLMIAAGAGCDESLELIKKFFLCKNHNFVTKQAFEKALRAHKDATDEMKSAQRDKAAARRARNPRRKKFPHTCIRT